MPTRSASASGTKKKKATAAAAAAAAVTVSSTNNSSNNDKEVVHGEVPIALAERDANQFLMDDSSNSAVSSSSFNDDGGYWLNLLHCAIGYSFFVILLHIIPNYVRSHSDIWVNFVDKLSLGYGGNDASSSLRNTNSSIVDSTTPDAAAATSKSDARFIAQFIVGTQGLHAVLLILLNLCYGILYYMKNPSIEKYKSSPEEWPFHSKDESTRKAFKSLLYWSIAVIVFNNVVISLPLSLIAAKNSQFSVDMKDFPDNYTLLWQVIVCALIEDALFYWSHRIFHIKQIYPIIHKTHHTWHMPIALSAEFAHPIEFYFGNTLPFALGPGLLKVHMFTLWIWLAIRLCKTGDAHSGYSFPWSPFKWIPFANPQEYHDYHHSEGFNSCYGSFFYFWDSITGTNAEYLAKKLKKNKERISKMKIKGAE